MTVCFLCIIMIRSVLPTYCHICPCITTVYFCGAICVNDCLIGKTFTTSEYQLICIHCFLYRQVILILWFYMWRLKTTLQLFWNTLFWWVEYPAKTLVPVCVYIYMIFVLLHCWRVTSDISYISVNFFLSVFIHFFYLEWCTVCQL